MRGLFFFWTMLISQNKWVWNVLGVTNGIVKTAYLRTSYYLSGMHLCNTQYLIGYIKRSNFLFSKPIKWISCDVYYILVQFFFYNKMAVFLLRWEGDFVSSNSSSTHLNGLKVWKVAILMITPPQKTGVQISRHFPVKNSCKFENVPQNDYFMI